MLMLRFLTLFAIKITLFVLVLIKLISLLLISYSNLNYFLLNLPLRFNRLASFLRICGREGGQTHHRCEHNLIKKQKTLRIFVSLVAA